MYVAVTSSAVLPRGTRVAMPALQFPTLLSAALWMEVTYAPDYWIYAAILAPAWALMSFGLIQPVKGAVVALQWHMGLDGFACGMINYVRDVPEIVAEVLPRMERAGLRRAFKPVDFR